MQNMLIALGVLAVALVVLEKMGIFELLMRRTAEPKVEEKEYLPYSKKQYLMTRTENEFYKKLEDVVAGRFYIFPQVNLDKIIQADGGHSYRNPYHNKIDQKSIDYVLFDKVNISPVLAIELDDSTHERADRVKRDLFVNSVLEHCGIKYLRATNATHREEVEKLISTL